MILWLTLFLSGAVTLAGFVQLLGALRRFRAPTTPPQRLPLRDMPTVSVCIPARNETYALADCLQAALASDYEKLEIIVLDDCSQDKTSRIIKSFAQDGVRFVQGEVPSEGWLGKNLASEVLARHANGDYLVFMGVDTHLSPSTITQLVAYTMSEQADMVSVLPRRRDSGWRTSVFLSPMRYFWQLVLPRRLNVPTSSALWMIRQETLTALGGFSAVSTEIVPEAQFARRLTTQERYRFVIGNDRLGVFYEKKWRSQLDTSTRLIYPTLRKQPLLVLVVVAGLYGLCILPCTLIVQALFWNVWSGIAWAALSLLCAQVLLYALYASNVWRHGWLLGALFLPYIVVQEMTIILTSMAAYLTGRVDWKGRNICYPVLQKRD